MTNAWSDFNDARQNANLIPKGTITKVRLTIRPGGFDDPSQGWTGGYAKRGTTGSVYLDAEYTVLEGPYAKRKIWSMIGLYSASGPNWANMGRSLVRGILNSARGLSDKDNSPDAQNARRISGFADLDGIEFMARIDVGKDSNGDDKNDIRQAVTASIGDGVMELAIAPTFYLSTLAAPVMLNYTEEVIFEQALKTGCMKINPYQNFLPMPAGMTITPAADYWEVSNTVWASPETVEFNRGVRRNNGPLVVTSEATQVVDQRQEQAAFLRQIAVAFRIEGMAPGELLDTLTFDGIDVKPPGDQAADAGGVLEGNFTIPSNVPVGSKLVVAEGAGGSTAEAGFVGQGVINTTTMRRVTTIERWRREPRQNNSGGSDPLAQTFTPVEPRQLVGVDVHLCLIGAQTNSLLVQQVGVEVGIPNEEVIAEAFVPMIGAAIGWKSARYNLLVFTPADRPSAIVIKTDDADHSLSIASLGGFDTDLQSYVGAQPYTTGVLLSSSNAQTWTPHQNDDLTFRLVAAKFGPLTKTVSLGTFELVDCSDLQVRAEVEAPSADCSVVFEIVRADASIIRLLPYQVLQLTEYVTETVQLRAILSGTEKLSPTLFAPVILVAGEIAAEGTYVTRAFKLGAAVKLTSYMKAMLPSGATLDVKYDKADDNWITLPLSATELLTDPAWVEKKFEATGITATEGRLKLTITGGPAARPLVGDLGAAVM